MDLQKTWIEFNRAPNSVRLDNGEEEACIYKGLKIVKQGSQIKILSTERDIYQEVDEKTYNNFIFVGFNYAVETFREDRRRRQL